MRFKKVSGPYKLYAVTGTNTVAFAIDCNVDAMKNLLGFTIEKEYETSGGRRVRVTVMGFKIFRERIPNPIPGSLYSTYDNPIQSFVWDDFSAYPGSSYTYHFTPLFDDPLFIRRGKTFSINVTTEPAWKGKDHSIFFNRGVASSQAYAMKFGNTLPDKIGEDAYRWLSRGLKEAMVAFINQSKNGDTIYGCFYEFRHDETLQALREAAERKVKLKIIYDAKDNGRVDSQTGEVTPSFPKADNEEAIAKAQLDTFSNVQFFPRQRNKSYISHNKFMILATSSGPTRVWTGSTNLSRGGIFGQANVGHSIDDKKVAKKYLDYWNLLKDDPDSKTLKEGAESIQGDLTDVNKIPDGVTCIFSPRSDLEMLQFYANLLDSAKDCACITLAFGVHDLFAAALSDNTTKNALTFLLLERDDSDISDYIYKNHVVKAVGAYIKENSLYKWVRETNTRSLKLNTHVMYVHTKFMLKDPLGEHPVVVTGSANFSKAATNMNDENMMIIKGNKRVADIYFTEYMRLFNHYYFRWIVRKMQEQETLDFDNPAFLVPDDSWTDQYKPGKYKRKRVEIFSKMHV